VVPQNTEALVLVAGVVCILAGLASGTIKAFGVEVPAISGRYPRIGLVVMGTVLTLVGIWLIVRPGLIPLAPTSAQGPPQIPGAASPGAASGPVSGRIGLGQTITGTLYYNEANSWAFSSGPATIDVLLDVGPYGEALMFIVDPQGVQREYVDAQSGREERLVGYFIPTGGDYAIVVRNSLNTQVDYRLTVHATSGR
jgi:hypothetical protein